MRTVILIGIFALVMLVSLMGSMAMARHAGVRRDLRRLAGDDVLADEIEHDTLSLRGKDAWTRLVTRIEASGLNLGDTREDSLRQKLRAAGYASAAAVRVYSLLRLMLVIGLPCFSWWGCSLWGGSCRSCRSMRHAASGRRWGFTGPRSMSASGPIAAARRSSTAFPIASTCC
jgi:hypothetical protein